MDFKVKGIRGEKSVFLDGVECFGSPHFEAWGALLSDDLEVVIAKHTRREPDWYNPETEEVYLRKGRHRFYNRSGKTLKIFSGEVKYPLTFFSHEGTTYLIFSDCNRFLVSEDGEFSKLFGSPWKRFVDKVELDELFVFADNGDGLTFFDVNGNTHDLFGGSHREFMPFVDVDGEIYLPASNEKDGDIELYSADGFILDKDRLPIHSPDGVLLTLEDGKIIYGYRPRQGILHYSGNGLPSLEKTDEDPEWDGRTNFEVFDFMSA